MSNHVHLVVVPHADDSLARFVRRVHSSYAQDFNRRRPRRPSVAKSFLFPPFGPSPLDAALLYVDRNPVRAAMTGTATAWEWSSARAHVSGHDPSGLLSPGGLAQLGGCEDWEQRLRRAETAKRTLRLATRSGVPVADAAFREEMEKQLKLAADRRTGPIVESVRARAAADQSR